MRLKAALSLGQFLSPVDQHPQIDGRSRGQHQSEEQRRAQDSDVVDYPEVNVNGCVVVLVEMCRFQNRDEVAVALAEVVVVGEAEVGRGEKQDVGDVHEDGDNFHSQRRQHRRASEGNGDDQESLHTNNTNHRDTAVVKDSYECRAVLEDINIYLQSCLNFKEVYKYTLGMAKLKKKEEKKTGE